MNAHNLQRFIDAQQRDYQTALAEIKQGRKRSHWMWYIFPQLGGLGYSETSRFYAIKNIDEAQTYLDHPILGKHLIEICRALLSLPIDNATQIFGTPDDLKLRSSVTLFATLPNTDPVFQQVLINFLMGKRISKLWNYYTDNTLMVSKTRAPIVSMVLLFI